MILILQWIGVGSVLFIICAAAIAAVLAVFVVPFRAIGRMRRNRIPRSEASRGARDVHAAAVRDYCLISPDYTMAVSLLHEGELTDLLGLAVLLHTNDRRDDQDDQDDQDEDDYADL